MYRTQFLNREAAGLELARALRPGLDGTAAVLGITGGGMLVAAAVAEYLRLPLYPLAVRKLGIPGHDKLSMGALAPGGVQVLDRDIIERLGIGEAAVRKVAQRESLELERQEHSASGCDFGPVTGGTSLIVDDGVADSHHGLLAAIEFARGLKPRRLVVAAPVFSAAAAAELKDRCEALVWLHRPEAFMSVDFWYEQRLQPVESRAFQA
jgi:putative phosphoribosyl transferase